jgi:hypothetical protein
MKSRLASLTLLSPLFVFLIGADIQWPATSAASSARPSLAGLQAQIDALSARTLNAGVGVISTSFIDQCTSNELGTECSHDLYVVYSLPPGTSTDTGNANYDYGFAVDFAGGGRAEVQVRSLPNSSVGDPSIEITAVHALPLPRFEETLHPLDRSRPMAIATAGYFMLRVRLLADGLVGVEFMNLGPSGDDLLVTNLTSESDGKIGSVTVLPYPAGATTIQVDVTYMNNGPFGSNYLITIEDCSSHIEPPPFQLRWKENIPFDQATASFELTSDSGFGAGDRCWVGLRSPTGREYDSFEITLPGPS